jgi:hypothetical protein
MIGGAGAANAATADVVTDGWDAQVSVPDVTWTTTSGCESVPIAITTEGWGAERLLVDLDVRHVQSGSTSGSAFDFWSTSAPNTVDDYEYTTSLQLCSFDTPPGTYEVTGTVEYGWSTDYDSYYGAAAPGTLEGDVYTTFTVSKMASSTRLDGVNPTGTPGQVSVSGRITGTSSKLGVVGVPFSQISLQQYVNGGWAHLGPLLTDSLGYFRVSVNNVTTPTPMRVVFDGTDKVAGSVSSTVTPSLPVVTPPPAAQPSTPTPPAEPTLQTAAVNAKAKSGASKLWVDVNPNKGSGYWTFQVQKKNANGTWKNLKSYKTKGSQETRTINLPKGTYRTMVKAKYGYGSTVSNEVYLKR